jgi:hypothetical protein
VRVVSPSKRPGQVWEEKEEDSCVWCSRTLKGIYQIGDLWKARTAERVWIRNAGEGKNLSKCIHQGKGVYTLVLVIPCDDFKLIYLEVIEIGF